MKKSVFLFAPVYLLLVNVVYGADPIGLDAGKNPGGHIAISNNPGEDFARVLKNTITILFAVGAMAFTIMIVWGAVSWILSGGDKEQIAGARKRITQAIIGLVLLSLSFVVMVVLGQILNINFLQTGSFQLPALYKK